MMDQARNNNTKKYSTMAKENGIVVGTVTANLLWALKDIETARNHYYIATETMRGDPDNLTDNMTVEEKAVFDNARDLVEKMIGDNLRTWANSTGQDGVI